MFLALAEQISPFILNFFNYTFFSKSDLFKFM